MHELSLAMSTVETVTRLAQQHSANKITAIHLKIGELSCVEQDALRVGLEVAARDTIADGARIEIKTITPQACCKDCQKSFQASIYLRHCPECGSLDINIESGNELEIDYMEVS